MRACNGLRSVVDCLQSAGHPLGLISGLAMPHYEGRLVILDADFAEAKAGLWRGGIYLLHQHHPARWRVAEAVEHRFPNSAFPDRNHSAVFLGVEVPVAVLEDLVQGTMWALQDGSRRTSSWLNDRADLLLIGKSHPLIIPLIPTQLMTEVDQLRPTA